MALIGFPGGDVPGLDFTTLRVAVAIGLQPVIDQAFDFDEAPVVFERLLSGRQVGKIVIRLPG
ncbi:zinc-binding dehydrogenase [Lichenicoccus sp.]|uniref:zinc-binding dehydrogenase n=1 Tax=Lichenicoccus sp. TaxID=2781899 RepID=UPI003D13F06E